MNCKIRSEKSELLDQPGIPGTDIQRNLYELSVINRTLGGHQITLQGFKKLAGLKKISMSVRSAAAAETT